VSDLHVYSFKIFSILISFHFGIWHFAFTLCCFLSGVLREGSKAEVGGEGLNLEVDHFVVDLNVALLLSCSALNCARCRSLLFFLVSK